MIGILDYGLGNIRSFSNIYKTFDIPHKIITEKSQLKDVKKIILPGVGAFDDAMTRFNNSGLLNEVESMVLKDKIPILGICVGLQILGNSSEEGSLPGLGWIDAEVKIIDSTKISFDTKLPHMGWNSVQIINEDSPLFQNLQSGDRFYFLHSYYFDCNDHNNIIAISDYGEKFTCAANSNNIYGVQFHPEKSLDRGESLLINFAKI